MPPQTKLDNLFQIFASLLKKKYWQVSLFIADIVQVFDLIKELGAKFLKNQ